MAEQQQRDVGQVSAAGSVQAMLGLRDVRARDERLRDQGIIERDFDIEDAYTDRFLR